MNITHVISSLCTGGAEKLVAELSIGYKEKGHQVKVISILDDKGVPYDMLKKSNIEIIELKYKSRFNPKIAYDIYKYTKDSNVVHTHTTYAQLYSAFFIPKKKLITTEHNTFNRRRTNLTFKAIDYIMYKKYKKIICISNATKIELNKWLKSTTNKSVVINNGINIEKYKNALPYKKEDLGLPKDSIVLINVARFFEQKNHINLIRAMEGVEKNIHLLLVGDGPLRNNIKSEVKKLGLEENIHFLGVRNDVDRLLKSSDIFILPSLWEGFGLVAVEARAAGLPLIISNVCGLNNIFTKDKYIEYIDPNNFNNIGSKINDISKMRLEKINISNNLYKFSINKMVDNYLDMYSQNN